MRGEYAGHRCAHLGCRRVAEALGLCGAHYMRRKRGTAMDRPVRSVRPRSLTERLRDAAIEYAEADTAEEFDLAWSHLREAARNYSEAEQVAA